ncbi:MAG: hypothetical protein H0T74_08535, partial [Rubrobacteraceae bacterium]|nr:hypothetical protein [Rubrobacteraceae bacterium]
GDEGEGGNGAGGSPDESSDLMVARVSAASVARTGQKMRLVIDGTKIRLFDPESEKAIL